MKVTQYFIIFYCYFLFLFNYARSVGDSACWNFFELMQIPILYEPILEIERAFHLKRKKQRIEEQRREARRNSNMVGGGGDQRRTLRDFDTPGGDQRRTLRAQTGTHFDDAVIPV